MSYRQTMVRQSKAWGHAAAGLCALAGLSVMTLSSSSALAADLGGDCCADLEERVATLEATAARKGNRKVSLTVSGWMNQNILVWDDGDESDAYVTSNGNDLGAINFSGEAKIRPGWTAGYEIELEIIAAGSDSVDQTNDDGDTAIELAQSAMFIESEQYGRVTWGFADQASDGAPEMDLSGSENVAYSAVADVAGGFQLRLSNGNLSGGDITIGALFDNFNGDTANIIRYESPTIAGFVLSASWGEDDMWDVALAYEKELGEFEVAAGIAYRQNQDNDGADELDQDTINGSISVLHNPTGLNLTFAAGQREFNDEPGRDDATFYYVKGGILKQYNSLGKTAIYGEYGQFDDVLVGDVTGVMGVDAVSGSEAKVYGFGIVQHIDAAEMQLYVGYRHYEVDLDFTNGGVAVAGPGVEDFYTIMAGARIDF
ncbi:MAG: porin [Rhodomicrobiaceae bacterium]